MRFGDWVQVVLIMVFPTLLVASMLAVGPVARAVRHVLTGRNADREPQPTHPPIERLAADLRRLLRRHDSIIGAVDLPMRAQRLRAVEGAIADCAADAAAALGVDCPQRPGARPLSTRRLRALLQALAAEGLVLPSTVSLLAGSQERPNDR